MTKESHTKTLKRSAVCGSSRTSLQFFRFSIVHGCAAVGALLPHPTCAAHARMCEWSSSVHAYLMPNPPEAALLVLAPCVRISPEHHVRIHTALTRGRRAKAW